MGKEREEEDRGISLSQGTIISIISGIGILITGVFWIGYNWNITSTNNKLTPKLEDRLDTLETHIVHGFTRVNKRIDDMVVDAKETHKIDSIKEATRIEEHRKDVDTELKMYDKTNKTIETIQKTK